ncbi:MAG TPA: Wzz/FepE/Etk N-terminal domain-containing protein [Thermoleophilaceae bacterium]|nr:Wzz/FepE/Etk N-terminal domain-containing protein [Thermoleophilaceae bacterium]
MATSSARRSSSSEERIDTRRYLDALKRSRGLIAFIVIALTGLVVGLSLALPDKYQATTLLVFNEATSPFVTTDEASVQRQLETTRNLLTTDAVLNKAALRLPPEARKDVGDIESSVDANANIIRITAHSEDPKYAAMIANQVANSFLEERTTFERDRIQNARERLEAQIAELENAPAAAEQIGAIRQRISELSVSEGAAGSDLQVAERADVPSDPASPRPLRNGVLALFGSLFLAVLLALGRDQLTPRVGSPRELGRLLGLPVLIEIPYVGGRRGRRRRRLLSGVEVEAYQTLRSSLELALPSERRPHVILMTGALHAEGKTTATARLGWALTQAGEKVLLVSADLRVPRLHEMFELELGIGLADVLAVLDYDASGELDPELMEHAVRTVIPQLDGRGRRGELHVIPSGAKAKDPGRLVAGPAMRRFLDEIRRYDYDYVLVDAPPLLGIADSQALARMVDEILLVNRLDRLTLERVSELRDVLDRLALEPLGIVVIGGRGEISPYYLTSRPALVEGQQAS